MSSRPAAIRRRRRYRPDGRTPANAVKRGVISQAEAGLIRDAETRRREALRVDDFSPEEWAALHR